MKLDFKVQVPYRLQRFLANPDPVMKAALDEADKAALTLLKTDVSRAAPKSSGALAKSIDVNLRERKVFSNSVYARAIELGHYAEATRTPKRMFLKFVSRGREVFLRYTRSKKQPYFFLTLHKDRIKVLDIYGKAFERMLKRI